MEIEMSSACHFQLRSFTPGPAPAGLSISGSVGRRPGTILIEYRLEGDLDRINLPVFGFSARRRHGLWRQTCFEFFFGISGESAYWEGNFSPSGDWNIYRFDDYRQGMREEQAVARPACHMVSDRGRLVCSRTVDVHDICKDSLGIEVGVACVVQDVQGAVGYWAIDHCRSRPDFHDRRSFLVELAAIDS
jgi:hypothetical protein